MALADRDYMRDDERGWRWSASGVLMASLIAAFVLQCVDDAYLKTPAQDWLVLTPDALRRGHVWQLLTFQFLHAGVWHLFGNLLGIYFFGRFVEERLGKAVLLKIYFAGGIAGGLLQASLGLLFPAQFGGPVVGASAGVVALLAAFAMLEPDAQILLWFVLPMRARQFLWISLAIALFFTVVPAGSTIANAAHLGGLLTGAAFIRWRLYAGRTQLGVEEFSAARRPPEFVAAMFANAKFRPQKPDAARELPPEEFISREVDPILDKISAHGIQSLTARERDILEKARAKMAKR